MMAVRSNPEPAIPLLTKLPRNNWKAWEPKLFEILEIQFPEASFLRIPGLAEPEFRVDYVQPPPGSPAILRDFERQRALEASKMRDRFRSVTNHVIARLIISYVSADSLEYTEQSDPNGVFKRERLKTSWNARTIFDELKRAHSDEAGGRARFTADEIRTKFQNAHQSTRQKLSDWNQDFLDIIQLAADAGIEFAEDIKVTRYLSSLDAGRYGDLVNNLIRPEPDPANPAGKFITPRMPATLHMAIATVLAQHEATGSISRVKMRDTAEDSAASRLTIVNAVDNRHARNYPGRGGASTSSTERFSRKKRQRPESFRRHRDGPPVNSDDKAKTPRAARTVSDKPSQRRRLFERPCPICAWFYGNLTSYQDTYQHQGKDCPRRSKFEERFGPGTAASMISPRA